MGHARLSVYFGKRYVSSSIVETFAGARPVGQLMLVLPPREVVERAKERERKQQEAMGASGELEFAAWMRGAAC